jgi:hypothetical protein
MAPQLTPPAVRLAAGGTLVCQAAAAEAGRHVLCCCVAMLAAAGVLTKGGTAVGCQVARPSAAHAHKGRTAAAHAAVAALALTGSCSNLAG